MSYGALHPRWAGRCDDDEHKRIGGSPSHDYLTPFMPIRQIRIVGTGLIGGSLGLALRKRKFTGSIVGCDRAPVLARARDIGAIDEGFPNPADAVRGSHVVVLATPVIAIIDLIE